MWTVVPFCFVIVGSVLGEVGAGRFQPYAIKALLPLPVAFPYGNGAWGLGDGDFHIFLFFCGRW